MNRSHILRSLAFALALFSLAPLPAAAAPSQAFLDARAAHKSPLEVTLETGAFEMRPGDETWYPTISPGIVPTDERDSAPDPTSSGAYFTSDPAVATVSDAGRVTAVAEGECVVSNEDASGGRTAFNVVVSKDAIPEGGRNMAYVAQREFLAVARGTVKRDNKYARWYYKKRKEVGWCAVFTSYVSNFAGVDTYKVNKLDPTTIGEGDVLSFLEGEVGRQYDGFLETGRFVNLPRPGYLVIYGNRRNSYRTTHIGVVVDVVDRGDGWYQVTTVEGNMGTSVKSFCYLYNSNVAHPKANMKALPKDERPNPLVQYKLATDYWSVFGFCATYK